MEAFYLEHFRQVASTKGFRYGVGDGYRTLKTRKSQLVMARDFWC